MSSIYAGSRTLTALAETGYAPSIFAYVDKSSRPLWSLVAMILWGPLAYINVVAAGDTVCTYPFPFKLILSNGIRSQLALGLVWSFHFVHLAFHLSLPCPFPEGLEGPRSLYR